MIVSRNELEMTARRAGLGIGLPFGLAEELGRAAAARPQDIGFVLDALTKEAAAPTLFAFAEGLRFEPPCSVLVVAPSVGDLLLSGIGRIQLVGLDVPGLLPAYLDRLLIDHGRSTSIETREDLIEVRLSHRLAKRLPVPTGEVDIDDEHWKQLTAYAARSLVPSDDQSRQNGAGAGLTDTD